MFVFEKYLEDVFAQKVNSSGEMDIIKCNKLNS